MFLPQTSKRSATVLRPSAERALMERRARTHGESGAAWVEQLPALAEAVAAEWSLRLEPHFDNLSYNFVAPCRLADGRRAVLKLMPPFDQETLTEIEALRRFSGHGCVDLIVADPQTGAMLIERAEPGFPVSSLSSDAEQVHAAASVIESIRRAAPDATSFPTIAGWIERASLPARLEKSG